MEHKPILDETDSRIPRVMDLRGTYKGGGGPDKTVLNSAAQHDPAKVHVLVTYLRQPQDNEFQIADMARQLGIHYTDVFDRSLIDWGCIRQLRDLLQQHRLTLVHAHDDKTLLYAWILRFLVPGLKIMCTCHSHAIHDRDDFPTLSDFLKFKLRQKAEIFLMNRFDKPVLTISDNTKRRLVGNGLREQDVAVLHNGIDTRVWRREGGRPVLREEFALSPETFLVGTVARITYEKDLPTFFRVAQLVAEQVPNARFVIVGDGYGDELEKARGIVRQQGLEKLVLFTGHRTDLIDVYASLDIFLMTSITEGMPNTLLEAMAMEVPAVATNVGGIPELIAHGRNGFLAPAGEAPALAEWIIVLLRDAGLRKQYAEACRDRIESTFSFARRVRDMEVYYERFCGPHAGDKNGNRSPSGL